MSLIYQNTRAIAHCLSASLFLSSCIMKSSTSTPKVINGDIVTSSRSPVVYLQGCSAVVVAPHQLLTAAHCQERWADEYRYEKGMQVEIVAFDGKPFNEGKRIFSAEITAVATHPTWHQKLKEYGNPNKAADDLKSVDLAIISINGNLPIKPASLRSAPVTSDQKIVLVGTGCRERKLVDDLFGKVLVNGQGGQWLQQAPLKVQSVSDLKFVVGTKRTDDPKKSAGACEGDSGGGSFLANQNNEPLLSEDGKWILMGISSVFAEPQNEVDLNGPLALTAIRTDTAVVSRWMKSNQVKQPSTDLEDTEPATPLAALDRLRRAAANNDKAYNVARMTFVLQKSPEYVNKLTAAQIEEIANALLNPENSSKTTESILQKYP